MKYLPAPAAHAAMRVALSWDSACAELDNRCMATGIASTVATLLVFGVRQRWLHRGAGCTIRSCDDQQSYMPDIHLHLEPRLTARRTVLVTVGDSSVGAGDQFGVFDDGVVGIEATAVDDGDG